ncbi:Putative lipopolysaccharide biosynthesis protein WalW [Serratia symbiotica]|nr:Putative lipopolysaccharide biosynthesis protein WalW [Serratia symbiotica]
MKPVFFITIDTEGDNLWENNNCIFTQNVFFLPRFQILCEKYHLYPVYLTNYEMVLNPIYVEFARDIILRNVGEIGMHLHAWNTPPLISLTDNDWYHKPYLIEYPMNYMSLKIDYITKLLEDTFQVKMLSHRAGRWAFNKYYALLLLKYGYQVDCSVTPKINWKYILGNPKGNGGTDYRYFPSQPYFMDLCNISKPGISKLLEVPMSIEYKNSVLIDICKKKYYKFLGKKYFSSVNWLRPNGKNFKNMKKIVKISLEKGYPHLELMLHSSELMPNGSPTFKNKKDIEKLYYDLEKLFDWLKHYTVNMTLSKYYKNNFKVI